MAEKLFFYDLETTGTNHWKHGIHQISGCIIIDGVIKERFNLKMRPHTGCTIDTKALEVSNVTEQQILGYGEPSLAHKQLKEIMGKYVDPYNKKDKFHLVGYNISSFDNQFLRSFFSNNGDNYFGSWFWSDCIDVMVMASYLLRHVRHDMVNFKQSTVARHFGIPIDDSKLHDAEYDINVCIGIYDKCVHWHM